MMREPRNGSERPASLTGERRPHRHKSAKLCQYSLEEIRAIAKHEGDADKILVRERKGRRNDTLKVAPLEYHAPERSRLRRFILVTDDCILVLVVVTLDIADQAAQRFDSLLVFALAAQPDL